MREGEISGSVIKYERVNQIPIVVQMKKFSTIVDELKHNHIDILKLDIEGSEFGVLPQILKQNKVLIDQICFETHERFFQNKNIKLKLLKSLRNHGYKLIAVSDDQTEFTFIKS